MSSSFFPEKAWHGMRVDLGNQHESSTWELGDKLSEEIHQKSEARYHQKASPSVAHGTFYCRNVNNHEQARMRIFMQYVSRSSNAQIALTSFIRIPYLGSEYMPAEDRSVQAKDKLYAMEYNEVETRKKLDLNGYKFAPKLLCLKVTKQDKGGIVPNGFIAFQLLYIVPGVFLGQVDTEEGRKSAYWESPPETREEIRRAFRASWE